MLSLKSIWHKIKSIDISSIPRHVYLYAAAAFIVAVSVIIAFSVRAHDKKLKEKEDAQIVGFAESNYEEGYVEGSDTQLIEFMSQSVSNGVAQNVIDKNKTLDKIEFASSNSDEPLDVIISFAKNYSNTNIFSNTFDDYSYEKAVATNTNVLSSREILSNHYKATGETLIMGTTDVTLDQMVAYYNSKAKKYPDYYSNTDAPTIEVFCQMYINECVAEGVRYDVAFCQAMKETGFLKYGGSVNISQFNFAGMGATGNGVHGCVYNSVQEGIRAHVQHLKAFASTADMVNTPVDQRWSKVKRGSAVYVEYLGINENPNHTGWATAERYGYSLMNDYVAVLASY